MAVSIIVAFFGSFAFLSNGMPGVADLSVRFLVLLVSLAGLLAFFLDRLFSRVVLPGLKQAVRARALVWIVLAVGLSVLLLSILPATYPEVQHLQILATGDKNPASEGSEVWFLGMVADHSPVSVDKMKLGEGWEIKNNRPVSYQNQPSAMSWEGFARREIHLNFIAHPHSGQVKVILNGQERLIDLYSPQEKWQAVELQPFSPVTKRTIASFLGFGLMLASGLLALFVTVANLRTTSGWLGAGQVQPPAQSNQPVLAEILFLRTIGCLSIAMIHVISYSFTTFVDITTMMHSLLTTTQMLWVFATPMFVFISELVISYNYRGSVPRHFVRTRAKYTLAPYLFLGICYALGAVYFQNGSFTEGLGASLHRHLVLAEFAGWFIVLIMQFYILRRFLVRYVFSRFAPGRVVATAALFNIGYLCVFNYVQPPETAWLAFIWNKYYLFFGAWILFSVLGYYAGTFYHSFVQFVEDNRRIFRYLPVVPVMFVLINHSTQAITAVGSKRVDAMLLCLSAIPFLLLLAKGVNGRILQFSAFISKYSFSIYLLHILFLQTITWIVGPIPYTAWYGMIAYLIIVWAVIVTCSILTTHWVNRVPGGEYLVGKIHRFKKQGTRASG